MSNDEKQQALETSKDYEAGPNVTGGPTQLETQISFEKQSQMLPSSGEQLAPHKKRSIFTDWMRSIAIYLVVFTHILIALESTTFGMPIFMYFSGRSASFSHDNWYIWIYKKVLRLLVPCLFGLCFIVLPTMYIGRYYRGEVPEKDQDISFFEFIPKFFTDVFPINGFEWLWFLPVLCGIAIANYPFMELFKKVYKREEGGLRISDWRLASWIGAYVLLLTIICCLLADSILISVWWVLGCLTYVFLLTALHFMPILRRYNLMELIFLFCPGMTLLLSSVQYYFTDYYVGSTGMICSMMYYNLFYTEGFVDQVLYEDYTEYREKPEHQKRKPVALFFFVVTLAFCNPNSNIDVGYLYVYPIFHNPTMKFIYVLGSWLWIYFLLRWCQTFYNDYIDKKQYTFFMESSMSTYLVHGLFIEIANNIFVHQFHLTFAQGLIIIFSWTVLFCALTYLLCKKVPFLGMFLGLETNSGSKKKKTVEDSALEKED